VANSFMEYVKLGKTSELFNKRGKLFQIDDETEVVIFKVYDKFYAVDNVCPHNHSPLMYDGYIEGMYVACPVHGFQFHLETGEQPTQMGCKIRTFDLKIENDYIYVRKPDNKIFDFKWD